MNAGLSLRLRGSAMFLGVLGLVLSFLMPGRAAELDEHIELCAGCHGENGVPTDPEIPVIWGQEFYYLYVQLRDYKAGRRTSEVMSDIVAELSKDDMRALAQYFSEQRWPRIGFQSEDDDVARARSAINAGMCTQCHLGGFVGDSRNPRLAGQQPAYLKKTMLEYKNRVRMNAPAKVSLFETYDEADIEAMAHYLSGL